MIGWRNSCFLEKMKYKILVLTSTFPRWRNDTDPPFVYELAKRLTANHQVTVLTPHYPGSSTKENMDGITIYRFRYFWGSFEKLAGSIGILPTLKNNPLYYLVVPFFLIAQLLSLISISRKVRPDVIHAHWIIPQGFMAFLAEKITGVPFVVTAHGADVFGLKAQLFQWLKRIVLNRAKALTVVSKALEKAVRAEITNSARVQIIPMGVSKNHFSPAQHDNTLREKYSMNGPFLLYVGRLTEKKGVCYLVEAMAEVVTVFPAAKLLIVGDGELASDLSQQVRDLKLGGNIVFVGAIANQEMPRYFATADVFVGPSIEAAGGDTEGFGLTFVEAAMSGCCVIGTDVGGVGDIIQDKETGFLVPQKKSKPLANAILYSLQNNTTTAKIAVKARQRCIENYDWQVITSQYVEVLKSVSR